MQAYQNRTPESSQPHVYMTADSAFGAMMKGGYLYDNLSLVGMKYMARVLSVNSFFRVSC